MPAHGDQYIVGKTYRSSSDPQKDEFQAWLNGPIDNGIRNSGGIRAIVKLLAQTELVDHRTLTDRVVEDIDTEVTG